MSNVIKFKRPASSHKKPAKERGEDYGRKKTAKEREDIDQRIALLGGEAIESLRRWRRALPISDRTRMARNMDNLIREFKVKPGKLAWERYGYRDKESFNRDLSRMRLPETAEPGRRLVAHNTRWLDLLTMVQQHCAGVGEQMTLEAMAERLTRGTLFHPTKWIHTRAEKLLYNLNLWANEVDEQCGLLKTYQQLALARAEHFASNMRDIHEDKPDGDFVILTERPADRFTNIPDEHLDLFQKSLVTYTDEDWKRFLQTIPQESKPYYSGAREDIRVLKANFDPRKTLFSGWTGEGTPSLSWQTDTEYLPRWFIGFYDHRHYKFLSQYTENYFSRDIGTLDPLDREANHKRVAERFAYLVLYPNAGMSRIVPYLFSFNEEGSRFEPLVENHLSSLGTDPIFPPVAPGTEVISKILQDRIEENYPQVRNHWMNTAERLSSHPLLAWSEGRETMIDAEIERLTTGPRSISKKEESNDS